MATPTPPSHRPPHSGAEHYSIHPHDPPDDRMTAIYLVFIVVSFVVLFALLLVVGYVAYPELTP